MKLVTGYLEQPVQFERLAAEKPQAEGWPTEAAAYHKLAAKRAQERACRVPKKPSFPL